MKRRMNVKLFEIVRARMENPMSLIVNIIVGNQFHLVNTEEEGERQSNANRFGSCYF